MEEDTGSKASDAVEESDSERRRRRRRRRKKKKSEETSAETQRLLFLARWAAGALVMFAVWAYGVYVYSTTSLGFGALIFLPAGIAAMICISYALAVPFFAVLAMIVGFIYRINSGPLIALQVAFMAFVAIGALNGVWQIFVFFLTKREVTRNEAGYK
jgi:ABC-type multidrug transport system fused ATPase/permease subunit